MRTIAIAHNYYYDLAMRLGFTLTSQTEKGWQCRCPSGRHNDEHPSAILFASNGFIFCQACGFRMFINQIAKAKGLTGLGIQGSSRYAEPEYVHREFDYFGGLAGICEANCSQDPVFRNWLEIRGLSADFLDWADAGHWRQGCYSYSGERYHPVRDKLVFAMYDNEGKMIGAEFRKYSNFEDGYPKVMYPAGCPKSRFVWNQHRVDKLRSLYVAEGILDLSRLFDLGKRNLASTYGSNLSPHQLKYLSGVPNVVWVLDRDLAGIKALQKLVNVHPDVRVLIPHNKDLGADSLQQAEDGLKNRVISYIDFLRVDQEWLLNCDTHRPSIEYCERHMKCFAQGSY